MTIMVWSSEGLCSKDRASSQARPAEDSWVPRPSCLLISRFFWINAVFSVKMVLQDFLKNQIKT